MQLNQNQVNSVSCLTFQQNEILAEHVTDFKIYIKENLEADRRKYLLNLQNVDFIDSSFLGALVSVYKEINAAEGVIKLTGLRSPVIDLLEQTRVYRIFEIYENEKSAMESFFKQQSVD